MTWWQCEQGGVLELDGVDLELEVRVAGGRTLQRAAPVRASPTGVRP